MKLYQLKIGHYVPQLIDTEDLAPELVEDSKQNFLTVGSNTQVPIFGQPAASNGYRPFFTELGLVLYRTYSASKHAEPCLLLVDGYHPGILPTDPSLSIKISQGFYYPEDWGDIRQEVVLICCRPGFSCLTGTVFHQWTGRVWSSTHVLGSEELANARQEALRFLAEHKIGYWLG